jgi:hypothetical protein
VVKFNSIFQPSEKSINKDCKSSIIDLQVKKFFSSYPEK